MPKAIIAITQATTASAPKLPPSSMSSHSSAIGNTRSGRSRIIGLSLGTRRPPTSARGGDAGSALVDALAQVLADLEERHLLGADAHGRARLGVASGVGLVLAHREV